MFFFAGRQLSYWLLILLGIIVAWEPTIADEQLSPAMQKEFGAATWIPESGGYFGAGFRYRERWQAFTGTQAYQEILTMPIVKMGLGWVEQPYLEQFAMMRAENPLVDQAVDVLQDAFSNEVFVYIDERGPGFTNQLGEIYNSLYLNGFLQGINDSTGALPAYSAAENRKRIIRNVLAAEGELRIPGLVFGFRLSDPQAGRDLIVSMTPVLRQQVPLPLVEESLGRGEYLSLSLNAAMFLTPDMQAEMEAELGLANLDAQTAEQFVQFVKSQSLSVSLGMRGEYLLISLGADNTHLSNLGEGVSLAESEAFVPLRLHFKPGMTGMSYVHRDWTGVGKLDASELMSKLQELLQQGEDELPPGLAERITKDATKLLAQINESMPEATPNVAASFWNQGIESISFSALFPGSLDSSEPLSILSHAGKSPMLALAAHSPPSQPHYDRLIEWVQTIYGYFEDYVVPQIPAEDIAEFKQFESLAIPALKKIHVTTRDLLLPSLDGGQSLFLLDVGGAMTRSPDTKESLARPIRFPRPAMVIEVNDPQKFVAAWGEYRQIFNSLMSGVAELKPNVSQALLPLPVNRRVENATLYTYPIPVEFELASYLNDDFEPHALLTDKHVVLSLSPRHSQQLLAKNRLPQPSIVDLGQPAGRAAWFDFLGLKDLVCDDAEVILALMQEEEQIDQDLGILIKIHIDKIRSVLGAVRSYRSRSFEEGGLSVRHSWLHLRDIER